MPVAARRNVFTMSILQNALNSASEEMFRVTARTAKSPIIYDVLDFSTALTDPNGDVIAQAVAIPVFIGMLDFNVKNVVAHYGGPEAFQPGDIIITNNPYISGTHLNDVALIMPIFFGDRLVAFALSKGHWNDIGGMSFGSWGPGRTEIYQEGLQIPPCKLFSAGKQNTDLVAVILANSRLPDMCLGDLEAQLAGLRVGAVRVNRLIEKYSLDTYFDTVSYTLESGSELALKRLQKLPHGRFEAQDALDEGGPDDQPLPVHVVVDISEEEFRVDFSGNPPQLPFSLNTTYPAAVAAVRVVYMALLDPHARYNQGFVRPLKVIAPEGTIFNALPPAPVSVYWEAMTYAADLVWKALAPFARERLGAGHFLSIVSDIVAGVDDRTGEPFALVEPNPGGWGASHDQDGESGLVSFADGETFASSVEVLETRYPLLVDQYSFNTDEGTGHGKYRGGFGIVKDYRLLNSSALFTTDINRSIIPPWGMEQGMPGTPNYILLSSAAQPPQRVRKIAAQKLGQNDVISIRTGSGGGWGNPLERNPAHVLDDVRNGLISPVVARDVYAVVIRKGLWEVDEAATEALRAERKGRQSPS